MTTDTKKSLLENMFWPIGNYIDYQKKFAEGKREMALEYAKKATNLHYQNKLANYKQKLERQLQEGDIYDKGLEMAFNGAYFLGRKGWQGTKYVGAKGLEGMRSFLGVGLKPMSRPTNKERENYQQPPKQESQRTQGIVTEIPLLEYHQREKQKTEINKKEISSFSNLTYGLVKIIASKYDREKEKRQLHAIKNGIDDVITSPDYVANFIIKNYELIKNKNSKPLI